MVVRPPNSHRSAVEPGGTSKLAVAILAWNAALLDFSDENVAGVDRRQQLLGWVLLPAEHHPECVGVDSHERLLHFFGGCRNGNVACGAALLKDFHVVNCGVAVEIVLMTVEGFGEFVEVRIARIEPAGTGESVPIALSDDVGSGV